jgi:hypothetical protein
MENDKSNERRHMMPLAFLVVSICALPLLYLASYGPVLRLTATRFGPGGHAWTNPQWVRVVYEPASRLDRKQKPTRGLYHRYITWWVTAREVKHAA